MPAGIIVRNAAGTVIMDSTVKCGRILGTYTITPSTPDGSFSPTGADQGTLYIVPINNGFDGQANMNSAIYAEPIFTVTATTISWTWNDPNNNYAAYRRTITLLYGVY